MVDQLPLPVLTQLLGRRRSWMLVSQLAIIGSILMMSSIDPKTSMESLTLMAINVRLSILVFGSMEDIIKIEPIIASWETSIQERRRPNN